MASGGAGDYRARVWDLSTGSCARVLTEHTAAVHGLHWTSSNTLLTGCEEGVLIHHDLRSPSPIALYRLSDLLEQFHDTPGTWSRSICTLGGLSGGQSGGKEGLVVLGCTTGQCSVFSLSEERLVADDKLHGDDIRSLCALPSPQLPHHMVLASYDHNATVWQWRPVPSSAVSSHSVKFWQAENRVRLQAHADKVLAVTCIPRHHTLGGIVTTGAEGKVMLWTPRNKL